ncbi:substrate-binding domain-containing protein [Spirillospora sp. NPDC048911]|uniref:substrate-binding domain-containing protein n=1 Tax=Spirillospora sp. NPDC048911 TaxID=3364527 RepID=UPI003711C8C8
MANDRFGAGSPSRGRRRLPVLLAVGALIAAGVGGGGAWALGAFSESCSGAPLEVTIAAQPEIVPALRTIADRFNVESRRVGGRCVRAQITAVRPADYVWSSAQRQRSDAWIPESSLWLGVARKAGHTAVPAGAPSFATSAVVLATTRPVEAEFRAARVAPTWQLLLVRKAKGITLARRTTDPAKGMTGTVAMIALGQVQRRSVNGKLVGELRRGVEVTPLNDLAGMERFVRPLAVTSEQAVVAYNDAHRPNPVVALPPREGTLMLDHPFAITSREPLRHDGAAAFLSALGSRSARETLQRFGFRTPEGAMGTAYAREHGLTEAAPRVLRLPTQQEIDQALRSWSRR